MPIKVDYEDPLMDPLGKLEVYVPNQTITDEKFPLYTGAHCELCTHTIKSIRRELRFGLRSCKVHVETCDESEIDPDSRFRRADLTIKHSLDTKDLNNRIGKLSGSVAAKILNLLPFVNAQAEAGGDAFKESGKAIKSETEYEETLYGVHTSGEGDWTLKAVFPHLPHLKGNALREIGEQEGSDDAILCDVITHGQTATITVSMSVSAEDIYVEPSHGGKVAASAEGETNRVAVATALLNRSLQRHGQGDGPDAKLEDNQRVTISRAVVALAPETDE